MTGRPLFGGAYEGKRVFITGHTGFKGAWLARWLLSLGAEVTGYALAPSTDPNLFDALGLAPLITHTVGDVRDSATLRAALSAARPEIVFHLAAQPLVRYSYDNPAETFETNVMGTVNVLEAVRATPTVQAVVNVTSDKCYDNHEWEFAYRENDAMGGFDPYSASKGCSELVTAAYRRSFFAEASSAAIATARAGNVIGGGDWAADRIIPDCVRALSAGQPIVVRNPEAVRPWQHVLEPLGGYLLLGQRLIAEPDRFAGAWNFGPSTSGNRCVRDIVENAIAAWGEGSWEPVVSETPAPHEATFLKLDCSKAADVLGWRAMWGVEHAVSETVSWYRAFYDDPAHADELVAANIDEFSKELSK